MSEPDEQQRGWGFPGSSRKAHYFDGDAIALCGKWMFTGPLEPDEGTSKDDCWKCSLCGAKARGGA